MCVPEVVTIGAIEETEKVPVLLVMTLRLSVENLGFHRIVMFVFGENPDPVILSDCPEITGFGEPDIVRTLHELVETVVVVVELVVVVLEVVEVVELLDEVVVVEEVEVVDVLDVDDDDVVEVLDEVEEEVISGGIVAVEK